MHELHVTLDEIVLRAPRGKYDAWLVKTRRKIRGTSPRSCCMRHVCCASESPSGEEAGVERYDVAAVPHAARYFHAASAFPRELTVFFRMVFNEVSSLSGCFFFSLWFRFVRCLPGVAWCEALVASCSRDVPRSYTARLADALRES